MGDGTYELRMTSFTAGILATIERNSELSAATKHAYMEGIQRLENMTGMPMEDLIRNPTVGFQRISDHYQNDQSRRAAINCVRAAMKHGGLDERFPSSAEKWMQLSSDIKKKLTSRLMDAQPTERERQAWMAWPDVLKKQRELGQSEYGSDRHLMLSMYTLIEPLRQDFGRMRLYSAPPVPPPTDENYMVVPNEGPGNLVLNKYKTVKTYKVLSRPVPTQLMDIIRANLRNRPRAYLFQQRNGQPYTKSNFVQYANHSLRGALNNPKIGVSLLRHSFISSGIDFNNSTPGQLFETAKRMGHSIEQQQLYRRFVEPAPPPPPAEAVSVVMEPPTTKKKKKKQQQYSRATEPAKFVPQSYVIL